ncbi:serine hydrolase domain-containing protein [Sedimentitalea nanhaiensis]|uniref:CubicO group peptidase, beta-lactamase class C family n=1 Tax=Sedimentitalea nanhaiensis TaxID=999627 RepID=A0A1I7A2M6_9RHOB|nr:serine hydrolase domain-containing protein [Sedimentitalea nanhaiensis]SFT69186.1 CubicO group peptidase, beta-lactamase class C family [Sedimentitalea nanhaiensis]
MKTAKPQDQGFDPDRLNRIASWMERYIEERKFAGSSVLIARGGREVYFHAAGLRSVENFTPFQRDTVARIYSMTKPITSVAAMMLAELGLFHLDAPVSTFLPAFRNMTALVPGAERIDQVEPCAAPTLHQLMTHTSGLSYPFNPGVLGREMDNRKIIFGPKQGLLADMADQVGDLPLAFHPGTRWEYSVGIDILGRVIEVVSGQSLDEFLAEHILKPLGMTHTAFTVPDELSDRFASLYTPLAGNAMDLNAAQPGGDTLRLTDCAGSSPFEATTLYSGGGGLVGTIDDYMRFTEMLRNGGRHRNGRLLSPKTLDYMMRNHLPGDIASMGPQSFAEQPMEGVGFGLGGSVVLDPARARCPGSAGDFSWGGMASTFFWMDPALDLSVVFFTQLSPSSSYPARAELKALVHGAMIS